MLHALTALVICLVHFGLCAANYACICSYKEDTIVYSKANVSSSPLGGLSSWECKQLLSLQVASQWVPLAYKHQVGYVEEDPNVMVQMCTGSPPIVDQLTTTTTTPATTTTTRTTTTASTPPPTTTTTTTTTTRPLTTPATTTAATWTPPPTSSTGNVQLCPLDVRQAASSVHAALGQFGTKCYAIDPHHGDSWEGSEATCAKYGGHLVHITSAAEQAFVHNFVAKHAYDEWVWIGLNDMQQEGEYKWSNGERLHYSNWFMFHQIAGTDIDDCVAMRPNGYWDDMNCGFNFMGQVMGSKYLFLCEFDYGKTQIESLFG